MALSLTGNHRYAVRNFSYRISYPASHVIRVEERPSWRRNVAGASAIFENLPDRRFHALGLSLESEGMSQHHRHRCDRADRICDLLAGNVRGRSVNRFIEPALTADAG